MAMSIVGRVLKQEIDAGKEVSPKQLYYAVKYGLFRPGELDLYAFLAVCGVVFLAWQSRSLHRFMTRNFVHAPVKGMVRTMFTSAVSHSSLPHLLFNGIAMYTIGLGVYQTMNGPYEFWAVCAAAAVASSVGSTLHMLVAGRVMAGLGASGVVMALLAINAFANPHGRYQLIFLPFFDFSGLQALGGVMALDVMGLLLGWTTFGHAAHLGGALFGLFYVFEGKQLYRDLTLYFQRQFK